MRIFDVKWMVLRSVGWYNSWLGTSTHLNSNLIYRVNLGTITEWISQLLGTTEGRLARLVWWIGSLKLLWRTEATLADLLVALEFRNMGRYGFVVNRANARINAVRLQIVDVEIVKAAHIALILLGFCVDIALGVQYRLRDHAALLVLRVEKFTELLSHFTEICLYVDSVVTFVSRTAICFSVVILIWLGQWDIELVLAAVEGVLSFQPSRDILMENVYKSDRDWQFVRSFRCTAEQFWRNDSGRLPLDLVI